MADYSELKRKAQEIKDEVKAGANTANRVGLALEETVKALEAENKRAEQAEENLENAVQMLQDETEDLPSIREKLDTFVVNDLTTGGADKALSAEMGKELSAELTELEQETKGVSINTNVSTIFGKFEEYPGRFSLNYVFTEDIDNIVAEGWYIITRYFDSNFNYLGTSYTSDSKYCILGGEINYDGNTITINDIVGLSFKIGNRKYFISLNGILPLEIITKYFLTNFSTDNNGKYINPLQESKDYTNEYTKKYLEKNVSVPSGFSKVGNLYFNTNISFDSQTREENIEFSLGRISTDKFAITQECNVANNHNKTIAIRYYESLESNIVLNGYSSNVHYARLVILYGSDYQEFVNFNSILGFQITNNDDVILNIPSSGESEISQSIIDSIIEETKEEVNSEFNQFEYNDIKWVYGASINTKYNIPEPDVIRAYWNEVQNCTPGDSISVDKSSAKIEEVMIRCFDAQQNYITTLNVGVNTIPNNCTQYFINIFAGGNATLEYLKGEYVTINGVRFYFEESGYVNPLQESKDYTDEKLLEFEGEKDYYKYLVGCFERIVCIGDSITAGFTGPDFAGETVGSNTARLTARNWVSYFKKLINSDVINLGYGSTATTHWRNSTPEMESSNLYCALDLAKIEGTQAYFIMLGWNDTISLGTPADIVSDYNNNGQSFYGNYDNIVRRLHEFNEKAHIFVFTLARSKKDSSYNNAIRYIANLYSYCHLIDYSHDTFFDNEFFNNVADAVHYSPLGYNAFAAFVRNLVSKYIYNNPIKFAGIPYTADTTLLGNIDVKNFALSSNSITFNSLNSYNTIIAEFIPESTSNKNVTWQKIDDDINCITLIPNVSTPYCTIKSNSNGTCLIRATDENGNTDECTIIVNDTQIHVTGISLDESSVIMDMGQSELTINATISPNNASNKRILWRTQSGGDSVITIETNQNICSITPRGIGTDTIIATTEDGNYSAQCSVVIQ